MALHDEKYVSLTTYRKNGESSAVPVWIADLGDGTIGFTTASSTLKAKRINNDPRVMLQPCDAKGKLTEGTEAVTGTAVAEQGAAYDRVGAIMLKKYGMQYRGIKLAGKVAKLIGKGSGTDTAVIITLD